MMIIIIITSPRGPAAGRESKYRYKQQIPSVHPVNAAMCLGSTTPKGRGGIYLHYLSCFHLEKKKEKREKRKKKKQREITCVLRTHTHLHRMSRHGNASHKRSSPCAQTMSSPSPPPPPSSASASHPLLHKSGNTPSTVSFTNDTKPK